MQKQCIGYDIFIITYSVKATINGHSDFGHSDVLMFLLVHDGKMVREVL